MSGPSFSGPSDAAAAAEVVLEAAALNRDDPIRTGNVLQFPDFGQVLMTGDLHGHRRNWGKIQLYANLDQAKVRHVILHEMIHDDELEFAGIDRSCEVLIEAAAWKVEFPDQVHFLQSNHELSQLIGHDIVKGGGVSLLEAFDSGIDSAFGKGGLKVREAIGEFIRSFPLAARTPNRVFLSHSLPSPDMTPGFDPEIWNRLPTDADLDGGSAYALVWGRGHTSDQLEALAVDWDADLFVIGHMPIDTGHEVDNDRLLILASNHNHGVLLPIDLSKPASMDSLVSRIIPLAGIE